MWTFCSHCCRGGGQSYRAWRKQKTSPQAHRVSQAGLTLIMEFLARTPLRWWREKVRSFCFGSLNSLDCLIYCLSDFPSASFSPSSFSLDPWVACSMSFSYRQVEGKTLMESPRGKSQLDEKWNPRGVGVWIRGHRQGGGWHPQNEEGQSMEVFTSQKKLAWRKQRKSRWIWNPVMSMYLLSTAKENQSELLPMLSWYRSLTMVTSSFPSSHILC